MQNIEGKVHSLYSGSEGELGKDPCNSIKAELDGLAGDRHRSFERESWGAGDKQPEGTRRRNERQWSAVSIEELAEITTAMDLKEPLLAATLGANLCLEGIPNLSRLTKGTILKFPSGAELMVEEYNPPCLDMGKKLAAMHSTNSGNSLRDTAFSTAAQYLRGLVGVIDVPGVISKGDSVTVIPYQVPFWQR